MKLPAKNYKPPVPCGHEDPAPGHYASKLEWVNGVPQVIAVPIEAKPFKSKTSQVTLKALMVEALNLPYAGPNPAYAGLTKGEAFVIDLVDQASRGDEDARKELLDRILGRPEQKTKSLKVEASLEDFLEQIDREESKFAPPDEEL